MEDKSKPTEPKPDESSAEIKEEQINDTEIKSDDKEVNVEEKTESKDDTKKTPEQKSEQVETKQPLKDKKKDEKKPEGKPKKKVDRGDDFKYIVRLSNTDVDGEKNIVYGLTSIKGIGLHMATLITHDIGIDGNKKIGELEDAQIEKIQEAIDNAITNAPRWMLNHRKDVETGEDIHLIGSEIDMKLRDEINILKKIRSYRGIRHERGLRVRGQRTRANNRTGLTLGVSKKREMKK